MPFAQAPADWWRGVSFSSQEMAYITDSASGPKVLLVTISNVGCNFWLVVVGMSVQWRRAPCGAKQVWCRKWCGRECGHLLRGCNAVATWWPLLPSIKNGLVGLKIHVQKKCWCTHALQSQWGESLSFILLSLLRLDMQVPGWLCYWRGLASGAALRPAENTDL